MLINLAPCFIPLLLILLFRLSTAPNQNMNSAPIGDHRHDGINRERLEPHADWLVRRRARRHVCVREKGRWRVGHGDPASTGSQRNL